MHARRQRKTNRSHWDNRGIEWKRNALYSEYRWEAFGPPVGKAGRGTNSLKGCRQAGVGSKNRRNAPRVEPQARGGPDTRHGMSYAQDTGENDSRGSGRVLIERNIKNKNEYGKSH